MDTPTLRRTAGIAATVGAALTLVELPLYFVYEGPPPDSNILVRGYLGVLGILGFVVFLSAFGHLIKSADRRYEWLASLTSTAGLMWTTIAFVSMGLEIGATIQAPDPIDPTITVSGTYVLYGTISRLLTALFMATAAIAILRTHILPVWAGRTAAVLAVVNIAFTPSMFFGNTPANFYAANGWGTTATASGLMILWLLAVGIALLRRPAPDTGTPAIEEQTRAVAAP
ncbi:hypothetical protein [Nocardia vermiculata]|uniref:Uncharacterized protein n=1 Tax=Nocardia vermiculata TaxID=257274 RepID=A0A846XY81_9NOCA|nr:hypothetical protein [Nocardia vermiculata]NKY52053.1 hypothetical protein [Nocardia vermiculata]